VPRVLIASPVRQKTAILRAFLDGLAGLDVEGLGADFAFVDDNDDPESRRLLATWDRPGRGRIWTFTPPAPGPEYIRDGETHRWTPAHWWRVAAHRDRLLQLAREERHDYVLLVDSDLVLRPGTLKALLACGVDIVSEVFWTAWRPDEEPLPNVWHSGQYNLFPVAPGEVLPPSEIAVRAEAWLARLRAPGLHRVGGLGACTLVSRRAIEAGVSYRPIPNLTYWGEDRHFCVRAQALGFDLWAHADPATEPLHLYRDEDLERLSASA
jgi:hypothetical protein